VATSLLAVLVFVVGVAQAVGFEYDARLMPLLAAGPGLLLGVLQLARSVRGEPLGPAEEEGSEGDPAEPSQELGQVGREVRHFLAVAAYLLAVWGVGFPLASFLFVSLSLWGEGRVRVPVAVGCPALVAALFHLLGAAFDLRWPTGILFR
jgi:hypothetical protein